LDDDLVELARRHSRARGPAYAITGDIAAGGWAIRSATDLLSSGLCDGVLVVGIGGDVGSRTKFWQELGELGSPGSYPLRGDRTGLRLGEGAAAILLERQGRCEVELRGSASSDDAAQAIRDALELAGASPRQLTWALCGADGRVEADRRLAEAIRRELGTTLPVASAVACRGSLGAAQDVAGIVDVVRSVDAGRIGPLGPSQPSDPWFGLNVVCEPTALETDLALTIHAGIDGAFNAFVLGVREP
jgi:hypothetical protein